jgi:5'-nucleotidase
VAGPGTKITDHEIATPARLVRAGWCCRVRILVTNDDGVEAPGIAALTAAARRTGNDVVVVAPLEDWSGASAAVGAFYRRDGVEYRTVEIEGVEDVPVYGVDGPPALGVILACIGGFGPRPDMVLSGINHGVNVGRSALHSGTIGAVLTAAQFGIPGLATSIRYGPDPVPWETAARLAETLVPWFENAPASTVLNLNVPDVEWKELQGIRAAHLGRGGTIRAVTYDQSTLEQSDSDEEGSRVANAMRSSDGMPPGPRGTLHLDLAIPGSAGQEAPNEHDLIDSDAILIGRNFATLTALVGVREQTAAGDVLDTALKGFESL